MKLVVNIPKEFVSHYLNGDFVKSLKKIKCDINNFEFYQSDLNTFCSNFEYEFLDMLKTAFSESKVVDNDSSINCFDEREHYLKLLDVDDEFKDHLMNCLKIFYSHDCDILTVKDYLLTEFNLGLIDCIQFGHLFFVFLFTLYLDASEIDELLDDLKKHIRKE